MLETCEVARGLLIKITFSHLLNYTTKRKFDFCFGKIEEVLEVNAKAKTPYS
ncbi:MAG: hypothetical protein ABH888_03595 [Patescibacteria group bacterium]